MESRWYGWQTLATDGASLVLVTAGGMVLESDASLGALGGSAMGLGIATYVLGGPIVHFAHENPGRAFASFGLRVGLPLVFGYGAVVAICGDDPGFCAVVAFPGAAVGIATAIALDAAVLARDEVPVDTARGNFTIVPTLSFDRRHAAVGVAGAF